MSKSVVWNKSDNKSPKDDVLKFIKALLNKEILFGYGNYGIPIVRFNDNSKDKLINEM